MLGIANSRLKDFYDVWTLARRFAFQGDTLAHAIQATFARRQTAVPDQVPVALTETFSADRIKQTQWRAFLRKGRLAEQPPPLAAVSQLLADFLVPVLFAETDGAYWEPGGPWSGSSLTGTLARKFR